MKPFERLKRLADESKKAKETKTYEVSTMEDVDKVLNMEPKGEQHTYTIWTRCICSSDQMKLLHEHYKQLDEKGIKTDVHKTAGKSYDLMQMMIEILNEIRELRKQVEAISDFNSTVKQHNAYLPKDITPRQAGAFF